MIAPASVPPAPVSGHGGYLPVVRARRPDRDGPPLPHPEPNYPALLAQARPARP
jgi:hypothetical protein